MLGVILNLKTNDIDWSNKDYIYLIAHSIEHIDKNIKGYNAFLDSLFDNRYYVNYYDILKEIATNYPEAFNNEDNIYLLKLIKYAYYPNLNENPSLF